MLNLFGPPTSSNPSCLKALSGEGDEEEEEADVLPDAADTSSMHFAQIEKAHTKSQKLTLAMSLSSCNTIVDSQTIGTLLLETI